MKQEKVYSPKRVSETQLRMQLIQSKVERAKHWQQVAERLERTLKRAQ